MERNDPSDRPCDFGVLASANRLPNWHLSGDDLAGDETKKAMLVGKEKKLLREIVRTLDVKNFKLSELKGTDSQENTTFDLKL